MKDLTSTSFGYLIAFLLPGMFGLYALSFWFPQVGVLLHPLLNPDTTVGPSVVFLLISIGMGLCVSAARFFLFEKFLCRDHHLPSDMFARLTEKEKLTSFKAVVDEHYRYHQFYGGCAVSLLILFFGWWYGEGWTVSKQLGYMSVGFIFLETMFGVSGYDSFIRYIHRGHVIVTGSEHPKSRRKGSSEK
jgi:hypothetical protein